MIEGRYCSAPGCTAQLSSLKETLCAFHTAQAMPRNRKHPASMPLIVTPKLYDELERLGHDMRLYLKSEPMP